MFSLLWIIPALPLLGFLMLTLIGARLPRALAAVLGAGCVWTSALAATGSCRSVGCSAAASHQ